MRVWLMIKYVQQKRSGLFFYRRRIPDNVQKHYEGKTHYQKSLGTKDMQVAKSMSEKLTEHLDALWQYYSNPVKTPTPEYIREVATSFLNEHGLAPKDGNNPVGYYHDGQPVSALDIISDMYGDDLNKVMHGEKPHTTDTLIIEEALTQLSKGKVWYFSDAHKLYLQFNGEGKTKFDLKNLNRPIERLMKVVGDKPLAEYTREDANRFRDWLYDATDKRLNKSPQTTSSVKRSMSNIKAAFNLANIENSLNLVNPFNNLRYRKDKPKERPAIPQQQIRIIQGLCLTYDDDMRWLIALISDTGLRLSEATGLEISHVILTDAIPYLVIEDTENRRLKTYASHRRVPLVGKALWAAKRAVEAARGRNTPFLFPRYNRKDKTNSNSASNGLNKWMKEHIPSEYVIHGFRHAMRDRLREIDCPMDVMDEIGGWSKKSIGQTYGSGSSLERLQRYMLKVVLD